MQQISRRHFLTTASMLIGAGCLYYYGSEYYSTNIEKTRTVINSNKLTKKLKILHFSDLHLSETLSESLLEETINKINSLSYDIICFTGDVVTSGEFKYIDQIPEVFSLLNSAEGKFAVLGNHDYCDGSSSDRIVKKLNQAGVDVLKNTNIKINFKGQTILLAGLDDPWNSQQDIPMALQGSQKADITIMLTHHPTNIEEISAYYPDVVLAGHTHGGQIYIPYLFDVFYRKFYDPRYIRGLYQVNKTTLYVNRGIGTTAIDDFGPFVVPPKRYFSFPEISLLEIS